MPALRPDRPRCPRALPGPRPLPDPAAVRLCLVPDPAPPYDEDLPGHARSAWAAPAPALRGSLPDQGGPGSPGEDRPPAGRPGNAHSPGHTGQPEHTPRPARPGQTDPGPPPGWPGRFAQVLAETLAGSRPPGQIVPWTTEEARVHIRRLGPRLASAQRPRVRRVVTSRPASGVVEMTVVVGFGGQVKALAVRLERTGPVRPATSPGTEALRWMCTAVEAA